MSDPHRIVALCLLTESELAILGEDFDRSFPVDEVPCSGRLLRAIDEADRVLRTAPQRKMPLR